MYLSRGHVATLCAIPGNALRGRVGNNAVLPHPRLQVQSDARSGLGSARGWCTTQCGGQIVVIVGATKALWLLLGTLTLTRLNNCACCGQWLTRPLRGMHAPCVPPLQSGALTCRNTTLSTHQLVTEVAGERGAYLARQRLGAGAPCIRVGVPDQFGVSLRFPECAGSLCWVNTTHMYTRKGGRTLGLLVKCAAASFRRPNAAGCAPCRLGASVRECSYGTPGRRSPGADASTRVGRQPDVQLRQAGGRVEAEGEARPRGRRPGGAGPRHVQGGEAVCAQPLHFQARRQREGVGEAPEQRLMAAGADAGRELRIRQAREPLHTTAV